MNKFFRFLALLLIFSTTTINAFNQTTDANGWGYAEVRQRSLLPIIIPLGAAALAGAIAFIVDQCEADHGGHSH
ncbi:MAG: hypothetical protein ACSNEK_05880 [Parachlamydiaceae bacterium]